MVQCLNYNKHVIEVSGFCPFKLEPLCIIALGFILETLGLCGGPHLG